MVERRVDLVADEAVMEAAWNETALETAASQRVVDPLLWSLGRRLKALRGEAKLSQLELATAAGMRKQFLNRVENGHQNVSTKTLWRLAEALDIPMASLFENVARATIGRASSPPRMARQAQETRCRAGGAHR